jgi:DUF3035 family protein
LSKRSFGFAVCGLALAPLALGGCTDLKRALGMEKVVPDEFAVVRSAPLALPPDFSLRPPRPGAAPSQEVSPTEQARQTIFRASDQQAALPAGADKLSAGENQLLRQAGAAAAPRDIRDTVNREATQAAAPVDESFADKLLFWRTPEKRLGPTDTVIDPQREAQRLKAPVATTQAGAAAAPSGSAPPAADAVPSADAPSAAPPAAQPELLGPPTIERKGEPKVG